MQKENWFNKVIEKKYFKDQLERDGVCIVPHLVLEYLGSSIDNFCEIYPLKKAQFTNLAITFIFPIGEEFKDSLDYVFGNIIKHQYERISILYGETSYDTTMRVNKHKDLISSSRNPLRGLAARKNSAFTKEYWMNNKGLSETKAIEKLTDIQNKGTKKKQENGRFGREYSQLCIEYWLVRGYNEEDGEKLVKEKIQECGNSRDILIKRHGVEKGNDVFDLRIKRFKKSMINEDGSSKWHCYTSKESIRFFIPIYKHLRKNGFSKDDIYWGIRGSKEYIINDSGVNMYDFAIPSIGVIIEYNGIAWHPMAETDIVGYRTIVQKFQKNTIKDAYHKDRIKLQKARDRGFYVFPIWNIETKKEVKVIDFINKAIKNAIH